MTPPVGPRRTRVVEFVGLPGVGKSTVAREVRDVLHQRGLTTIDKHADRRHHVLILVTEPRIAVAAARVGTQIISSVDGPRRARLRRAGRTAQRLGGFLRPRTRAAWAVFDEGPMNWALSNRWRDERRFISAVGALARAYASAGVVVVVLDSDDDAIQTRRKDRKRERRAAQGADTASNRDAASRRDRAMRRRRRERRDSVVQWPQRRARLQRLVDEVRMAGVRTTRLRVEPDDTPSDVAGRVLEVLDDVAS